MAAPSYTEDLTDITLSEDITNWTALGGGASGLGAGADFSMQGTNCVDKAVSASEKGQIFNFGSTITPAANTHFFVWVFLATPGLASTLALRGLAIILGTATTAYNAFHVEGSDTYGGEGRVGICYPIRYVTTANGSAPFRTLTGSPGANPQFFGATANITATVKSSNLGVDAMRYGTGAYITAGDSTTPATFAGFAAQNDLVANRWGIFSAIGGGYELQGRFVVGQNNAGTPTLAYFSDSNRVISFVDTVHSLTDFTQVIVDHASTEFYLTNCTFQALGTHNPGRLVFNNASTVSTLTGCTFAGMGITTLRAGVTANGCTWRSCGQIGANSAIITNSDVSGYTGATDTSALVWNTNVDPNGKLDGTSFTKGTGTTHAIEFGLTSPTSMTLTNVNFSGYGADGSTSAALHIKRTTGTVTINIIGGTTPTYKSDGATVVIVSGTVTVTLKAQTATGTAISGANVFVQAVAGGPFPVNASVTIANSGTTATVTHNAHGLAVNDKVLIKDASLDANNGIFTITGVTANTYTYTMLSTPGSSPTGSITSTFVILNGTTDGSGNITMSRVYPSAQPFSGWARKSTTQPYYKTGLVSGTVSSTNGASPIALMIADE